MVKRFQRIGAWKPIRVFALHMRGLLDNSRDPIVKFSLTILGQHRRRAGDGEGHELGQGDPEIGQEGGDDGPGRAVLAVGGAHGARR